MEVILYLVTSIDDDERLFTHVLKQLQMLKT